MKIKFTLSLISHNDKLDEDHHRLFDEANEIIQKIENKNVRKEDIKNILDYLKNYSNTHFALEEKIMESNRYHNIVKHKKLHQKIKIEIDEMIKNFNNDGAIGVFAEDLKLNLIEILYSHIKTEDQKFIEYLHLSNQMDNML